MKSCDVNSESEVRICERCKEDWRYCFCEMDGQEDESNNNLGPLKVNDERSRDGSRNWGYFSRDGNGSQYGSYPSFDPSDE